jgi:hypothetical protein
MNVPEIGLTLRNHDYYMELSLNVDPIEVAMTDDCSQILRNRTFPECDRNNCLILEGTNRFLSVFFHPSKRVFQVLTLSATVSLDRNLKRRHMSASGKSIRAVWSEK